MAGFRPEVLSDAELERLMRSIESNPENIPNRAERQAVVSESLRRSSGRRSAAPNVDANNDAAATPIVTEPVVSTDKRAQHYRRSVAAGLTPNEAAMVIADMDRRGVPFGGGNDSDLPERVAGLRELESREDQFANDYNAALGQPHFPLPPDADTVTVDGVQVLAYRDSAGNVIPGRYLERDVANAKRAQAEAQRVSDVKWMNERSPEFWQAQKDAQQTPRAQELRSQRLHARAGIPEPTDGLEGEAKLRAMIRNRETAQAEARRARLQAQGLLTGGNRNRQDNAMVNALLMLSPEDREQSLQYMLPGGDRAAAVDSRQLDQAARWAGQAVMGAVANGVGRQAQEGIVQQERIRDLRSKAVDARDNTWGDPYDAAKKALEAEGASPPEVQQILGELFPAGPVAAGGAGVPTPQRAVPTAPHPMNGLPAFGR